MRRWLTTCLVAFRDPRPRRHQCGHLGSAFLELGTGTGPRPCAGSAPTGSDGWIIDELHIVVGRKRPDLLPSLEALLAAIDYELARPGDPSHPISDPNDQPILDAAVAAAVDVVVTGDRRFLSLGLDSPRILTVRSFLNTYSG